MIIQLFPTGKMVLILWLLIRTTWKFGTIKRLHTPFQPACSLYSVIVSPDEVVTHRSLRTTGLEEELLLLNLCLLLLQNAVTTIRFGLEK